MRSIRAAVAAIALALFAAPHAQPAPATLPQLQGVQELKGWFNSFTGHPRLIFLLSPT